MTGQISENFGGDQLRIHFLRVTTRADKIHACCQISLDGTSVTLHLGKTLVMTTVTATMEAPSGGRYEYPPPTPPHPLVPALTSKLLFSGILTLQCTKQANRHACLLHR